MGRDSTTFTDYSETFAPEVQRLLRTMRSAIKEAAPDAAETISYGMPAFTVAGKKLVWFGAFKSHIGFYPGAAMIAAFKRSLAPYTTARGSVQLPIDQPLPIALIKRIVAARRRSFE